AEQSDESEETIEDLYRSMSDEERKAHYNALKKVMAGEEMAKSEEQEASKEESKTDEAVALVKAEMEAIKASNEELKKQNEELKKNLDGIVEALKARFIKKPAATPKQKAITELGALNKSETK